MRLPTSAFRSRRVAVIVLIAALVAGGLAACRSTRAVSSVNAATHTQETLDLLEEGVRSAGRRAARRNVAAWEQRLRSEDVPPFDDIADTLDDLEAELDADAPDGMTVGRILTRLGSQTRAVAGREGAPERLDRLAELLVQAGKRLRGAGEEP